MSYPQYNSNRGRRTETEPSAVQKMKETYWTTKQVVMKKLGKKEDESLISSDAQLDAKLEVFKAVQKSCMNLQRCIEIYQDRLCMLSHEENSMGRFLKSASQADKTRAGEIMNAVGKAQGISSQQRLALRNPLMRLYSEVDTFRNRAIEDTLATVQRMEQARTEYRGALLWMKDGSNNLDPDTSKQLEKFRKVQLQVKKTKVRFDQLKLDSMQKIDLLVASRCNMLSQSLAVYQTSLLDFWSKTSNSMTVVAEAFKGYQYFEFNLLKILDEPVKELSKQSNVRNSAMKDTSKDGNEEKTKPESTKDQTDDGLIDFDQSNEIKNEENNFHSFATEGFKKYDPNNGDDDELLGAIDNLSTQPFSELDDFLGNIKTTEEGFSTEWTSVFGKEPVSPIKRPLVTGDFSGDSGVQNDASPRAPSIMTPSCIMDNFNLDPSATSSASSSTTPTTPGSQSAGVMHLKHKDLKKPETDKSDWFKLFADLDPLANPDAIGKSDSQMNEL